MSNDRPIDVQLLQPTALADKAAVAIAQLLSFGCADLHRSTWSEDMRQDADNSKHRFWASTWSPCGHLVDECPNCGRLAVACSLIERIDGRRCPICVHLMEGKALGIRCASECALCFLAALGPAAFKEHYRLALLTGDVSKFRSQVAARAIVHGMTALHALRIIL